MSPTTRHSDELPSRQYANHRAEVLALLRSRFGSALNESDREDLYRFRARIQQEAAYPYLIGYSKAVMVKVTG